MKKTKLILTPLMIATPIVSVVACGTSDNATIKTGDFYDNLSLTFDGTNRSGFVKDLGVSIPENTFVSYWVNGNKSYTSPKTLSNGDTLKLQLYSDVGYVLDDSKRTFEVTVSGLQDNVAPIVKTKIDVTQFLSDLDVSWAGKIGSATISPQKQAPNGSEYKFSLDNGLTWNSVSSNMDLQNDDEVQVGLKLTDSINYELINDSTKTFIAEGLTNDVVIIEHDAQTILSQANDEVTYSGTDGSGTLTMTATIPRELEFLFSTTGSDGTYTTTIPTTLTNGDNVHLKLKVKDGVQDVDLLNPTYSIQLTTVSGLVPPVVITHYDAETILDDASDKVSYSGLDGSGSLNMSASIPADLELLFSTGGAYSNDIPTSLSNGDVINIKLEVKSGVQNVNLMNPTYTTQLTTVSGLTPQVVVTDYDAETILNDASDKVSYSGVEGSGTLFMSASIPNDLELLFSTGGSYSTTIPTSLSNGDVIDIKLQVKSGVQNVNLNNPTYTTQLTTVSGLTSQVVVTDYDAETILNDASDKVSYSGNDGSGTLTMSASIPNELELLFSTGGSYSTSIPTSLSNDDIIDIMIKVKDNAQNINLINPNYVTQLTIVSGLVPQVVVKDYDAETVLDQVSSKVTYSGMNGSGTLTMTATIPSELEFLYSTTTWNGSYSSTIPTTLSNGDRVYVRVKVKDGVQNVNLANPDFSPALTSVSGLTNPTVVFDTIDRNSTINYVGTGTYTVAINTANVPAGLTIGTNIYETDMFIYKIHDDLKMDDILVTESEIHDFIRKFEGAVPYGVGMYNNFERQAPFASYGSYAQVDKPTFAIIGFDSTVASSTSGATTEFVEVKISSAFRGPLSKFSTVALHEWIHNDGHMSNIMLSQYLQTNPQYVDFKADWRANTELAKYAQYFEANWDSVANPGGLQDTIADIDTPWGTIPAGTDRFNDNMDPYIFNNAEVIARMMEVYASNYTNDEYLTSSIVQTTASLYEEFGSAPYDSLTASQAVVDIVKDGVYGFDKYGGHLNAIAHLVDNMDHIATVDFAFKFGGNYGDLQQSAYGYGDYFKEIYGGTGDITSGWKYSTYDVDYKPTSFMFNPILGDGVYDEIHNGRLYYADDAKMSDEEYALMKVWEFGALFYHVNSPDDNSYIQWSLTAKDIDGNVLNEWDNTDHTPW